MNQHLDLESLNAYLDGELHGRELSLTEQHLAKCADCSSLRHKLAAAAGRVASLEPVQMTADERRVVRQAVIKARPEPASGWGLDWVRWSLAGGLVLVAVAAFGFSFVGDSGTDRTFDALTEASVPDSAGPDFNFASGREVDETVASLPEVAAGLQQYRADDAVSAPQALARTDSAAAPEQDSHQPESRDPAGDGGGELSGTTGSGGGLGGGGGGGATDRRAESGSLDFSNSAADACLVRVAGTQDYPMVALLAREARFEGRPTWLLVFAWSPQVTATDTLDRWQAWVLDPRDCANLEGEVLESRALHRSFSPPS